MSDKVDFQFLLWFDLASDQMLKRLLYRASQSKVKRADDKEEVMKKRIATFESSIPIFEKYRGANQLMQIDANGGLEEIFANVEKTFGDSGLIEVKPA